MVDLPCLNLKPENSEIVQLDFKTKSTIAKHFWDIPTLQNNNHRSHIDFTDVVKRQLKPESSVLFLALIHIVA